MRTTTLVGLVYGGVLAGVAALAPTILAAPAEVSPTDLGLVTIVRPTRATPREELAVRELRRYIAIRTGHLPVIADTPGGPGHPAIVISTRARLADDSTAPQDLRQAAADLTPGQYLLRTRLGAPDGRVWIVGGDDTGALHGAFRFVERLGVRFQLQGDVIPDGRIAICDLADGEETGRPIFDVRGIQPFHDFPEGPDWWTTDDYLAYVGQLAKLRMNFLGLHCYPEGGVGAEPLVWIGPGEDLGDAGEVRQAYRARWAHTDRSNMWGYAALNTTDFCGGAAGLFPADPFGHPVFDGIAQEAQTPAESVAVFNRAGNLLRTVFTRARELGVKTCIGTETPLTIPKAAAERLKTRGLDPQDPAVVQSLYDGMFRRIAATHPLDYYWLWTPEGWTWGGNKPEQFEATVRDIRGALAALDGLGRPFTLATCGWVLGPQHDRAALDRILPKDSPMSCINRQVGHAPVEPGFASVQGRPKWAIPWMENDPNLVAPQPWVGRMRADAVSARRLGCTGLLGIHWRTKAMALNVAALAAAAWDQSWVPAGTDLSPIPPGNAADEAQRSGRVAAFHAPVADTDDDAVYQDVRYDMDAYRLPVPAGQYTVRLQFNEPHYAAAGQRVFGVRIQGRQVLEHVDLFARVGRNRALDFAFPGIGVTTGGLAIVFTREVEFPCIAGIVVTGVTADAHAFAHRINCGGGAWRDYVADPLTNETGGVAGRERAMPVADFYLDFALASFGPEVAQDAARILAGVDGVRLPEPSTWIAGPGGIRVNPEPWEKAKAGYAFVDELAALRPRIPGPAARERFDYWLNTYRAMAAMAEAGCQRGRLDALVAALGKAAGPDAKRDLARQAVDLRRAMARTWERMIRFQIAAADTPGELGTLANLEQHNRIHEKFLTKHDDTIARALGGALPADIAPSSTYEGPDRLVVPTIRAHAVAGEALRVPVWIVTTSEVRRVEAFVRPLGGGREQTVAVRHVGRGVHEFALPPAAEDVEYRLHAELASGAVLDWPAGAPTVAQSVIVTARAPAP